MDRELDFDVAPVVLDERLPSIWVAAGQVPGDATVQHARRGGVQNCLTSFLPALFFFTPR
ncbi:hypothetical protein [Corynebacterium amycolatum]|uniref:hypothetical protein n=1 Tax=Corynebacterium amycolatum TaxID=43765 RepID=UPI001F1F98E4|nr:hypothetical protein [Corynebacterium amycolatum]